MVDWEKVRIELTGQIAQGIVERDTSWTSKIADDLMYKKVAKHCVTLADALIEELKKEKN